MQKSQIVLVVGLMAIGCATWKDIGVHLGVGKPIPPAANPVKELTKKYLVKKEDGLFYAAKPVADLPYSGKMEEISRTDGSLSVKIYRDGVLTSIDEYFSGSEQKKSTTTFDGLGGGAEKRRVAGEWHYGCSGIPGIPIAKSQIKQHWAKS